MGGRANPICFLDSSYGKMGKASLKVDNRGISNYPKSQFPFDFRIHYFRF